MGQRSVRFPDELEARALIHAKIVDRPFSYLAVRALERYLEDITASEKGALESALGSSPLVEGLQGPASSRAPIEGGR